jgi:DNA-binding MarR family transcriptional regulator
VATAGPVAGAATASHEAGAAAELLAAIGAVRRTARRAVRQRWHAEPLPMAQAELLRLVAAQPGISVAEAAAELRLAPNTVSTLVGRLVTDGLLTRERVLADGRAVRLSVTAKARQRLASYRDLRAELTRSAMARLAPADAETLASAAPALLRLAEQLEQP